VGHGIDGGSRWPTARISDDEFLRVLQMAVNQRLLGALAEAVDQRLWSLPIAQRQRVAELHASAMGHVLKLERTLLQVAEVFGACRIEFRVLKGAALAHLVYSDPTWRGAADVDILVRSDHFDRAVTAAVEQLGAVQSMPELRPGFDREFGKESLLTIGEVELDLHRTFVTGPFGLTVDLPELFHDQTEFAIGGRQVLALGAEHRFLHACYDAALGDYPVRLGAVRDLLMTRRMVHGSLDGALATAQRWHGTAVVRRAAQLAVEHAGHAAAGDLAPLALLPVSRREAWLLRSSATPAMSYSRPLTCLLVIPGMRARLRYARAIVAPSPAYLRSRGWTRRSHIRRAFEHLSRHG
jgi:hypothetical protein